MRADAEQETGSAPFRRPGRFQEGERTALLRSLPRRTGLTDRRGNLPVAEPVRPAPRLDGKRAARSERSGNLLDKPRPVEMFISERDGEITRFFGTVRELQRQSVFVPFAKHPHRRIGHNPEIQRFNQRLHGAERGAFQPERTGPGRGVPEKQRIHPDRQNRFGERLAQIEHQRGAVPVQPRLRRDELRILRIAEDGESRDLPAEVFGIENQGDRPPRQIDNLVPALTEDKFVADAVEQKPVSLQSNGTASAPVPEKFVPVEAIQRINRLVARQLQHRRRACFRPDAPRT